MLELIVRLTTCLIVLPAMLYRALVLYRTILPGIMHLGYSEVVAILTHHAPNIPNATDAGARAVTESGRQWQDGQGRGGREPVRDLLG